MKQGANKRSALATEGQRASSQAPKLKLTGSDSAAQATVESGDLGVSFGSQDGEFVSLVLNELAALGLRGPGESPKEEAVNRAIAAVHGVQPRDEVEAMLATQMFAAHRLAMEAASRANCNNPSPELRDMHVKHMTKLMGVFAKQIEALQRYRGRGRQKMTVEHVHVHSGGQAVVGSVSTGPDGGHEGVQARSGGTTP